MLNVKLAFERYMDFVKIKRRESMLKWCLELPSCVLRPDTPSTLNTFSSDTTSTSQIRKQGIAIPLVLKTIMHPQLRTMVSLRKHLRLIKRDFTSTTTRFFDNNFDILVDGDTSDSRIQEDAHQKYEDICSELKFFKNAYPEAFTPDIIMKVSKLFDWLYSNKQFCIAYQLLHKVSPNYDIFFKFNQYSKMIEVFDKFGKPNDLFQFCEVFKYDKIPNIWRKVDRLGNDESVTQLIKLSDVRLFEEAKPLLDNLLQDTSPNGLKYFTFRVCSSLYKNFDSNSKNQLYDYLLNLSEPLKKFFPPSLISQLVATYSSDAKHDLNSQYIFLESFMRMHYNPNDINENSYQYKLISSLSKDSSPVLKFKLWFDYCYNDEKLRYDRDIRPIIYLRNNRLHFVPRYFEKLLGFDASKMNTAFSILIYTHSKYEPGSSLGQTFYQLKKKFSLPISGADRIGYLRSLTSCKKYAKAFSFLQQCLKENPEFETDETLNPILIVLAKNKDWGQLESIYNDRYEHNEVISKDQYITLFIALSIRPGTNKIIMELWENYLKRGFEPNDQILSSIILCFINNKSYEESLQWFTAYSHYNVDLTSKSYGLMLHALAGMKNTESIFRVLNELTKKIVRLPKNIFSPVFVQLAQMGDYKSIETILTTYYPQFNLSVERDDTRWIMKCHYHANRFTLIIKGYLSMGEQEILYKDSLMALESAIKYSDVKTFERIWTKAYAIHNPRGDLDIKAYIHYMAYWVRKYGAFGIEMKLNEIKQQLKCQTFPTILFNQMIFSCLRTHRPWLTKKVVRIALMHNVVPSPKTYSLILQSNVCMPWVARNSIDETVNILQEFLVSRKEDKFGKLNDDINPMSLKLVLKAVIKYKDAYEARRLFEIYVESSRDNLLDNLHILNIELILLGEEERWVEFDGCYDRYMTLLFKLIEKARFSDKELNKRFDNDEFSRLDVHRDVYLRSRYDEYKIRNYKGTNAKIPNWIKKAHSDLWIYRLKQLEVAERLGEVNEIMKSLIAKGLVFDNKNLNETALFLSQRPNVMEEAATFIDKFILPHHIKERQFKLMRLRYATDELPGIRKKSTYSFDREVYFEVMKNFSDTLNERLTPEQREELLNSISNSPNKYILKNMEQILKERRHIRSSYLQTKRLRTVFYRGIRSRMKAQTKRKKKNMNMWRLKDSMNYKERMQKLKKEMDYIIWKTHVLMSGDGDDKHTRRMRQASKEVLQLQREKHIVRGRMNELRREKNRQLNKIIEEDAAGQKGRSYKVGRLDLNQL